MTEDKKKILILGGGFAGIKAALELADNSHFAITLISDQENFRYYPALYRSATGSQQSASSIPLEEIFTGKEVELIRASAQTLDPETKTVMAASGKTYSYDILVVALGVVTNYFGIKGLEKYAYGIKTQDEARALRDHIHKQLVDGKKPDVNYVIVGGGPTGVELAGALPGYVHHVMRRHNLPGTDVHIDLVEAEPRLVPRMPRPYSIAIRKRLRKLGVKLYLDQSVQGETADTLMVDGRPIESHTVVWTAGVTNHPFLGANDFVLNDHGRTVVDEYLQSQRDIYVIGDNADTRYSGMAQTALYDAVFVAENLKRQTKGKKLKSYKHKRPIYITPVGRRWAAVLWGNVQLYGWIGWLLRSTADLIGYHDYEPWWRASQHWLAETKSDNNCRICS